MACAANFLFFLLAVVKETLENRGVMSQLKARIRAEVFRALDDQTETKPTLSNENLLINELIREYLEFNDYKYAASVLKAGKSFSMTSSLLPMRMRHFAH